ncbi:MAG TPA: hypothetical protein VGM95_07410 [Lactobacillaceae bacterium]|jgi:hypothetical protein
MNVRETIEWIIETINPRANNLESYLQVESQRIGAQQSETQDNQLVFFKEEDIVMRVKTIDGSVRHVDTFLPGHYRPYKRTYVVAGAHVSFSRYYELDTWQRNYDVYLTSDFRPIFTRQYTLIDTEYIWLYDGAVKAYTSENFPSIVNDLQ